MFVLYDQDFKHVSGKYQYGSVRHAKKRAENIYGGKLKWGTHDDQWAGIDNKGKTWFYIAQEMSNPKRKKTMRKKKRSAKQLANDKRLGRMAKKRAKVRRGGKRKKTARKKVARRKVVKRNPHKKRKVSAQSHLFNVFRCRGKSVYFLTTDTAGKLTWTGDKGKSVLWKEKQKAASVARKWAGKRHWDSWQIGVCNISTTSAQIAAGCQKGK